MHLQFQKVLLVLIGALFTLSYAGCSGCSKGVTSTGPWIGRRGLNLFKKRVDARHKCGTTIGIGAVVDHSTGGGYQSNPPKARRNDLPKRDLTPFPNSTPNVLNKRMLVDFPADEGEQDSWMVTQVESAATDVVADGVQNGDGVDDINSGQFFKIGGTDYTKDPVTIGLGRKKKNPDDADNIRLTGCTALIVMSEKAVWFGHLWETLSYDSTDEVFQQQVIDFINNGGTQNPNEQQSLKAHADDFKGVNGASAWILYPVADDVYEEDGSTKPVYYKDKNTKLQQAVKDLTGITATMTEYTPSDENNKALGRSLYQYDPQARAPDPNKPDQPIRGFRFIHEHTNEGTHFF